MVPSLFCGIRSARPAVNEFVQAPWGSSIIILPMSTDIQRHGSYPVPQVPTMTAEISPEPAILAAF